MTKAKKKKAAFVEVEEQHELWTETIRRYADPREAMLVRAADWNDPEGMVKRQLAQDLEIAEIILAEAAQHATGKDAGMWRRVAGYTRSAREAARAAGKQIETGNWYRAMHRYRQVMDLRWKAFLVPRELDARVGRVDRAGRSQGGHATGSKRREDADKLTRRIQATWERLEAAGNDPRSLAGMVARQLGLHRSTIDRHMKKPRTS